MTRCPMKKQIILIVVPLVAMLLVIGVALAAVTAGYDLSWWTADGGGGTSSGGNYSLSGTIGQPDAGPVLSGPGYQLSGGFWPGSGGGAEKIIYLPLVVR